MYPKRPRFQKPPVAISNNLWYRWLSENKYAVLTRRHNVDGVVQDCSNYITNALELLQSCTEPSMFTPHLVLYMHRLLRCFCFTVKQYNPLFHRGLVTYISVFKTTSRNMQQSGRVLQCTFHLTLSIKHDIADSTAMTIKEVLFNDRNIRSHATRLFYQ